MSRGGVLYRGASRSAYQVTNTGSSGQVLTSSGTGADPRFTSGLRQITCVIDGGGSAITTGVKAYVSCPVAGTITRARLLADVSGSIVIDVWKDTYANYPPVDADSITASAPPTLASAIKSDDTTLTGWNKTVNAGDVFGFNVDSATTVTRVVLQLTLE